MCADEANSCSSCSQQYRQELPSPLNWDRERGQWKTTLYFTCCFRPPLQYGLWSRGSTQYPHWSRGKCFSQLLVKGTQDWEFFWLRFWNLRYFFDSYVKILRFYKKIFLIGSLFGEVRFFRVVLGLRRMKKNFEVGLYRTSGVIFFIDYCTAIRDT